MIEIRSADRLRSDFLALLDAMCAALNAGPDTDAGVYLEMAVDLCRAFDHQALLVQDDLFIGPKTSTEALDKHAAAHFASGRKSATTTDTIEEALGVLGEVGANVPVGSVLVHQDGTRFQITRAAIVTSFGSVLCDVQSLDSGTRCNKLIGEKLSFETPPAGIEGEATLVKSLIGAVDAEGDAELACRLIDVIRNPHAGGRASDYRQWAMEVAKVAGAYIYCPSAGAPTGRRGLGTVDIAILSPGTGGARTPAAATATAVGDFIEARRPAGVKEVLVLTPAASSQNIDIQVEPCAGYDWDWSDAVAFTVAAWDPSGPKVTWSGALPAAIAAGVRLMIRGQLCEVVSVGVDFTIIDRVLTGGVALVGESIYPGGPLTEPVQQAVTSYLDSLGPARGVAYDRLQPGWDDTLRLSRLFKSVVDVAGVEDAEIATPTGNVTPLDHVGGTVDYLVPGIITVRPLV